MSSTFHLAIPVTSIEEAESFIAIYWVVKKVITKKANGRT